MLLAHWQFLVYFSAAALLEVTDGKKSQRWGYTGLAREIAALEFSLSIQVLSTTAPHLSHHPLMFISLHVTAYYILIIDQFNILLHWILQILTLVLIYSIYWRKKTHIHTPKRFVYSGTVHDDSSP